MVLDKEQQQQQPESTQQLDVLQIIGAHEQSDASDDESGGARRPL